MSCYKRWGPWEPLFKDVFYRWWDYATMDGDLHPFYRPFREYARFKGMSPPYSPRVWPPEDKSNDDRLLASYAGSSPLGLRRWVKVKMVEWNPASEELFGVFFVVPLMVATIILVFCVARGWIG